MGCCDSIGWVLKENGLWFAPPSRSAEKSGFPPSPPLPTHSLLMGISPSFEWESDLGKKKKPGRGRRKGGERGVLVFAWRRGRRGDGGKLWGGGLSKPDRDFRRKRGDGRRRRRPEAERIEEDSGLIQSSSHSPPFPPVPGFVKIESTFLFLHAVCSDC